MTSQFQTRSEPHLSFKGNLKTTRYGWLRLTPAYSVHLVAEVLERFASPSSHVLDPFCGTGTTALVCAERGIQCDTADINPFLIWLAQTKTRSYEVEDVVRFEEGSLRCLDVLLDAQKSLDWVPPIHQIEKWWDCEVLGALSRLACFIREESHGTAQTLLQIAFCRLCIESSNASFGHQSMSFKKNSKESTPMLSLFSESAALQNLVSLWSRATSNIADSAQTLIKAAPRVVLADARDLSQTFAPHTVDCVLTSPPYPNRMSYIRELRPYMYWLGFLQSGRDAGELDWQAIGGTWGCATSNLNFWTSDPLYPVPFEAFSSILEQIGETSPLLSRYVHKYFEDMTRHFSHLWSCLKSGASLHYIVGNSKFYDVMLPVEQIYAAMMNAQGFEQVQIETIRKRTSKKELFEFRVSARKPER